MLFQNSVILPFCVISNQNRFSKKFTILGKKYLDLKICKECFLVINTEIRFFAFNKESGKQHLNLDLLKFQEILSVNLPKTLNTLIPTGIFFLKRMHEFSQVLS